MTNRAALLALVVAVLPLHSSARAAVVGQPRQLHEFDRIITRPVATEDGRVFFAVLDAVRWELWTTDGTAKGTRRVGEPIPPVAWMVAGRDRVYLATQLHELLVTDGTAHGLQTLATLRSIKDQPGRMATLGNQLFFYAIVTPNDPAGFEPWVSDGTVGGTRRLMDIEPGPGNSYIADLTPVGDRMFFAAWDSRHGMEPWVSDGTPEGTRRIADIRSGEASGYDSSLSRSPWRRADGTVVFGNKRVSGERELWITDFTAFGTRKLADSGGSPPLGVGEIGGRIVYFADDGYTSEDRQIGYEPWTTDGTAGGTALLADLYTGPGSSLYFANESVAGLAGGALLFKACRPAEHCTLWRTDGTAAGTRLVMDIDPDDRGGSPIERAVSVADTLLFMGDSGGGFDLWQSDGTAAGTFRVMEFPDETLEWGGTRSSLHDVMLVGGRVFLKSAINGRAQLWTVAVCGDGHHDAAEACDDGNTADGDCCSSTCGIETTPACTSPAPPQCGNGAFDPREQCDDGNPCTTDDACTAGVCRATTIAAPVALCMLGRLLDGPVPLECSSGSPSPRLARSIDRSVRTARKLLERSAHVSAGRAATLKHRAARRLGAAERLLRAAMQRGKLDAACAEALASRVHEAAAIVAALAG